MPIIKVECYTMNFIRVVKVSFMKKSFVVQRRMFALKIILYCNRFLKKKFCTSPNIVLDGMLSFNKHISLYQNVCIAKKNPKQINIVDYSHENNKKSVLFPCSHKP